MQASGSVSAARADDRSLSMRTALRAEIPMNSAKPPRQAGDAVLAIVRTLVRVTAQTVLARRLTHHAHARDALIEHDSVTDVEVVHLVAYSFDCPRDLMPEHLRRLGQRDGPAGGIEVVVGLAGEDVEVGATDADGVRAHDHIIRTQLRVGDLLNLHAANADENAGKHPVSLRPRRRLVEQ